MTQHTRIVLAKRPAPGLVAPDTFRIETGAPPEPGPGQLRIKVA
ncbi:MAG: N-terminal domain of oxidoreductase, partial [Pseudomonadota bacterium]